MRRIEYDREEVDAVSAAAELPFGRILGTRWIDAIRRVPHETNV